MEGRRKEVRKRKGRRRGNQRKEQRGEGREQFRILTSEGLCRLANSLNER